MGEAAALERHGVELFDDPAVLGARVAAFLAPGLTAGGAIIVIARALHLESIATHLRAAGLDAAIAEQRAYLLDAEETLAKLLDGDLATGRIDATRFEAHIETLVRALSARGLAVHAYGEMVDILWTAGNPEALFELERQWTAALDRAPFRLLCGYRLAGFDQSRAAFDSILDMHDCVHSADGHGRDVAQLQQRARALQLEVERRERVERLMSHLIEITNELAGATTRADVARTIVERGGQLLGTSAVGVWTLAPGGQRLELLGTNTEELVRAESYRTMPLASDTPVAAAIRTNESVYLGSLDEYGTRFPASRARIEAIRAASHVAFAIVPFALDHVRLAICFTYAQERTFDDAERNYQTLLARHCTSALARIQSLEDAHAQREVALRAVVSEKHARADVELLYEMIATFNRLDDIDDVYQLALAAVKRGSKSDRAAILLFDETNAMRFRAWSGLSETYRIAVDGHSPWKPGEGYPAPIVVADTDTDPAWTEYRHVFRSEGIRALAFIPIVHRRTLIGKFMLYRNAPLPFEPRDLQLTATVAVHVAQAVERKQQERELARVYQEEVDAHRQAEEAASSREEILSVVSHDLRNPLGTILMGAATLLNVDAGEHTQRVRTTADRIHRQAERMARLIENIVDFSGLQRGRVVLERARHSPHEILSTTRDIFGPIASERGLRLDTEAVLNLPPVECDSNRAVQVLSNLVSNALKVTPKGGQIAIGAALNRKTDGSTARPTDAARNEIVFYVRDTGPGIEPEQLPKLFERYWRGKETSYQGAGLGLSIARGIVDAHGGRIWAESRPGSGSTFYFSLTPSN